MSVSYQSRLVSFRVKTAREHNQNKVLPFGWMARYVSFPVSILNENCVAGSNSSHLPVARLKFHVAIQPYGEESTRWCMKARFAHPCWDVDKADAGRWVVSREL